MLRGDVAWVVVLVGLGGSGAIAGCGGAAGASRDAGVARDDAAPEVPVDARPDVPGDARPDAAPPGDAALGVADLELVASQITASVQVVTQEFHDGDCEIVEGCVGGTGPRKLLEFALVSANRGTGDLVIGVPPPPGESNQTFAWSACYLRHYVRDYARFELFDGSALVRAGEKEAFCLEDSAPVQPGIPSSGYSCSHQGITRGWADVYDRGLSCQWIDVTGLAPGTYTLRLVVNPHQILPESDRHNNVFTTHVTL